MTRNGKPIYDETWQTFKDFLAEREKIADMDGYLADIGYDETVWGPIFDLWLPHYEQAKLTLTQH